MEQLALLFGNSRSLSEELADDADGWFWNEAPPTSILGRLRLHGLAFVGRSATAGRRAVVVPRELREPLVAVLETAGREEGL